MSSIKELIKEIYYVTKFHDQYTVNGVIQTDFLLDKIEVILKRIK
jgi:hypothetical protein